MNNYEDFWILGERDEQGMVSRITLELLNLGRQVADAMAERLCTVFIGDDIKSAAEETISRGSDRVYTLEDPSLATYSPDLYLSALEDLWREHRPRAVLAGHTAFGQDMLPRLAVRLNTRVVTDCVEVTVEKETGTLLMTKPIYGGNALAVYRCESLPPMATVRMRTSDPAEKNTSREGEIIKHSFTPQQKDVRTKIVSRVRDESEALKLSDAPVVIAGGRGMGGPHGFAQLQECARVLGGALGASRPPCDLGWISSSSQVGFTGHVVAPRLYMAVGISGAMQHISGISESKNIVAVNNDPNAGIFNFADYGVVGDYREVLPAFAGKLEDLLNS
jgi:electron transfer flavoprotein alpha subunit